MDEPTAGVDVENQRRWPRPWAGWPTLGHTMIIVTHELEALSGVVTRVVTIAAGRLTSDVGARNGPR